MKQDTKRPPILLYQNGSAYTLPIDEFLSLITTEQLHRKALWKVVNGMHEHAELETGNNLQSRRDKETEPMTRKAIKPTPDESLAALIAQRQGKSEATDAITNPASVHELLKEHLMADAGREAISYRDNVELSVTSDGKLAILLDVSNAVELGKSGWGSVLYDTAWTNAKSGKTNHYHALTESIAIRCTLVIRDTRVSPESLTHDCRIAASL